MYPEVLSAKTQKVFKKISQFYWIKDFYLTGGSALALQINHRQSDDLDFFTPTNFNPQNLQIKLKSSGKLTEVKLDQNTLNCFLDHIQLQFLYYPYKLLKPKISWQNIWLSSKLDIACTKLITISSRGSKKDFIDLFFLLQEFSLPYLIKQLDKKYTKTNYNITHILKSLVYFQDADNQPDPKMHQPITWAKVKSTITIAVKNFPL